MILPIVLLFETSECILALSEERILKRELKSLNIYDTKWSKNKTNLFFARSTNKKLVYEMVPFSKKILTVNNRQIIYKTNSFGFRDYEFRREHPKNLYRIIAVGDSVTFGWSEYCHQTYPKVLERRLRQQKQIHLNQFEVYNMGVDGYNTLQEVELVKSRALHFQPDLIIIGYVLNDTQIGADAGLWWYFNRSHFRTVDYLKLRWLTFQYTYLKGQDFIDECFGELAKIVKPSNIPVVVTIFPVFTGIETQVVAENGMLVSRERYLFRFEHKRIAELARKHGFWTLDLLESFEEAGLALHGNDELHPNMQGHNLAANILAEFIQKNFLSQPDQ